jgi:hypothetical protein
MSPQKNHNTYTARYLVLLGEEKNVTRALLFAQDQRYLSEVFDDDGLLVDNLMRGARACPPPTAVAARAWADAPSSVQCFALGEERVTSLTPGTGCNA